MIAAFFILGALLFYLKFTQTDNRLYWAISLVSFLCALLSKEVAVTLPGVVLSWEIGAWIFKSRSFSRRRFINVVVSYGAILVSYAGLRYLALGELLGGYGAEVHIYRGAEVWLHNLATYFLRSLLPPLDWGIFAAAAGFWTGLLLLGSFGLWGFSFLRRKTGEVERAAFLIALAFLVALIPSLTLKVSLDTSEGERFLYLPTAFLSIFVVLLIRSTTRNQAIGLASLVILIVFYGFSLGRVKAPWLQSTTIVETYADAFRAAPETEFLILPNAPDSFKGVPVFRNGLWAAQLIYAPDSPPAFITGFASLENADTNATLEKVGDAYLLSSQAPVRAWPRPFPDAEDYFTITDETAAGYTLVLKDKAADSLLLLYSSGEIQVFDNTAAEAR